MNLRQIEVFRAVMLAGSVTDAARLLHVSQPGISRMLAHIELQLGLALFERRKGRLLPTPEAQALYAEVSEVYGGIRRVSERAEELKSGARLSLRVLASPSTAMVAVPRAVAALASEYPAARIYLETLPTREMLGRLTSREADLAISTIPTDNALLASRPVGKWRLVCVFPRGHALASKRLLHPRDILKERLISFSRDTPQGRIIDDWCASSRAKAASSIEVRSGQMACALAACGAGVAIVDDLTAHASRSDELDFRPIVGSPSLGIYALTHEGFAPSVLGKRMIELATASLKQASRD
ncbi:LysR family transcriptional regulator [Variovorax saccharolyticus]|uniref:LysR family transcriptional regulator n=1 Tax=Variovorax saccharolyticus TaxID=3053516 RepID=UPI0025771145|nr:LysR substrate-binding domain-containing protein [Variovorax sp. J31P216]MDM0025266.1 LysR substrate-binding domain-containing protein [Variovorax sp. J31P216]